jgi:hypothetical protein
LELAYLSYFLLNLFKDEAMNIFDKDGRLLIPISERKPTSKKEEDKVRYIIGHAYCPNGCSIIDSKHKINGWPGLRIKFKRTAMEGE